MPRFVIHHITRYTYPEPVRDSANQIMLYPITDQFQLVQGQKLIITGDPVLEVYQDYYGNQTGSFMNAAPHTELRIDSHIAVVTFPRPLPAVEVPVEQQWQYLHDNRSNTAFLDFLKQELFDALPEVKKLADPAHYNQLPVFSAVQELNSYVYTNFRYIKGVTSVTTTADEIWKIRAGVCQDFAHVLLDMLRILGIPARYVSGYVCPHDHTLRGEGATHAWVEAYIPHYGWLGFDPTNNCVVNDQHVRLAVGRNFTDVSPVRGTYKGTAAQTLEVGVSVSHEDGQVNKETAEIIAPKLVASKQEGTVNDNSYQRYLQMMQQQQ